jgi:hypothetical protein
MNYNIQYTLKSIWIGFTLAGTTEANSNMLHVAICPKALWRELDLTARTVKAQQITSFSNASWTASLWMFGLFVHWYDTTQQAI